MVLGRDSNWACRRIEKFCDRPFFIFYIREKAVVLKSLLFHPMKQFPSGNTRLSHGDRIKDLIQLLFIQEMLLKNKGTDRELPEQRPFLADNRPGLFIAHMRTKGR